MALLRSAWGGWRCVGSQRATVELGQTLVPIASLFPKFQPIFPLSMVGYHYGKMAAPTEGRLRAAALIFASPQMRLNTIRRKLDADHLPDIARKFCARLLRRLQVVRTFSGSAAARPRQNPRWRSLRRARVRSAARYLGETGGAFNRHSLGLGVKKAFVKACCDAERFIIYTLC